MLRLSFGFWGCFLLLPLLLLAPLTDGFLSTNIGQLRATTTPSHRSRIPSDPSHHSPWQQLRTKPPITLLLLASAEAVLNDPNDERTIPQQQQQQESSLVDSNNNMNDQKTRKRLRKLAIAMCSVVMTASWMVHQHYYQGMAIRDIMTLSNLRRAFRSVYRPLKYGILSILAFRAYRHNQQVQRRQSADATSEWGRYASDPAARGRAVGMLLMKLVPFWIRVRLHSMPSLLLSRSTSTQQQKDNDTVHKLQQESGILLAESLLRLGPLYIKLGQIISNKQDWIPEEWIGALERLQDKVPAQNGTAALQLAHAAMGSPERFQAVFQDFDTRPLAAASLGQVHRAVLRDSGDVVAVKLQRPYLRKIYDQDLAMFGKIATMMDKIGSRVATVGGVSQSWTGIYEDAKRILYREIDYRDEAENGLRIARDFGIGKGGRELDVDSEPFTTTNGDTTTATTTTMASTSANTAPPTTRRNSDPNLPSAASWLRVPHVYQDLSSEKVLVMEYVPSIKITDRPALDAASVSAQDRTQLADSLARAYLRSFCNHGFFSTDPHAGNLGVEVSSEDGAAPKLVLYDFGQACELQPDQSDGILSVLEAIIDMDADRCVDAFASMGVLKEGADLDKVRAKVRDNFATGKIRVERNKLLKKGYVFSENDEDDDNKMDGATTMSTNHNQNGNEPNKAVKDSEVMGFFTLPAEYAFVARALTQMDGVGKSLDPTFDFVSSAAPHIVEVKGASNYLADEVSKRVEGLRKKLTDSGNEWWKNMKR